MHEITWNTESYFANLFILMFIKFDKTRQSVGLNNF